MTRIAVYPGSFDPPTRGHEDLVRRSLGLADQLIVAVAVNLMKQPLFSVEERLDMLRAAVGNDQRVSFESFDGLLAEFAKRVGATIIIRGLPAVDLTYRSSSLVREVARFGGDVNPLVHPAVAKALARRFRS